MGLPWTQVPGSSTRSTMRSSTWSEITGPHSVASSWARCHGRPITSTRNRSASRCRRTRLRARPSPSAVNRRRRSPPTSTSSRATSRFTASETEAGVIPSHSASRARWVGMPSSSISKMASRYSWSAVVATAEVYNRTGSTPRGDMPKEQKRIFLLDGHSLSYRAYFALPTSLATSSGQVTNAVYGFTSMLIKLLTEERPDRIAVAFDKGAPTVRLEKYAEYKAGRAETPDEFREQLGLIREVLEALRIPIVEGEGHEADDAIATLASKATEQGMEAVVVTADRDFFQLVRPGIRVMFNRRGISDIVDYDERAVQERFGLPPEKYIDYVALKGDPSDNIPGVPGVGEKTASRLIQEHGSVERVLEHVDTLTPKLAKAISAAGDQLVLNKELARLRTDIDVPIDPDRCVLGDRDDDAVRRLFNALEFRTLLERLEEAGVARAAAATRELDLEQVSVAGAGPLLDGPVAVAVEAHGNRAGGVAVSPGDGRGVYIAGGGERSAH